MEKTIEDRKPFRELAISSLNAQMKNRTRVTGADLTCHLTQLDCGPVQSFLGRGVEVRSKYMGRYSVSSTATLLSKASRHFAVVRASRAQKNKFSLPRHSTVATYVVRELLTAWCK